MLSWKRIIYISLLKNFFLLYFMVRVFVYADRFWFILDVYVVPSEAPCDGHLLWLLLCGW